MHGFQLIDLPSFGHSVGFKAGRPAVFEAGHCLPALKQMWSAHFKPGWLEVLPEHNHVQLLEVKYWCVGAVLFLRLETFER